MSLESVFNEAAERVKQLPEASNEDKLELYSLFKQSNTGDCDTGKITCATPLVLRKLHYIRPLNSPDFYLFDDV